MDAVNLNNSVAQLHDQQQIQHQHQERHLETQSSVAEQDEEIGNLSNIGDLAQVMPEDIVSIPKEMILISLVSQEQALFNPKHEHYRSTQRKDAKWLEIAENVGWQDTQCKAKWKALRDQYCRELKRSKMNLNTTVKWKYFKVLDFLRPYALARHYRSRSFNSTNPTATSIALAAPTTFSTNNNTSSNNASVLSNSIKISANMMNCNFPSGVSTTESSTQGVQQKNESVRLMPALTAEQINSVIQQQDGNWSYLATTSANGSTTMTATRNDQPPEGSNNIAADDALYNALVNCVSAATSSQMQSQQQQQQQLHHHNQHQQLHSHTHNAEEEDEDPIHTFLNIESYFEKELISLIHQEDVLYDNSNQHYRNVKLKVEVWDEIARKLKKSVKQCRQKWKALRDQFIREHKRLKTRDNLESMPRWKHYDALSFLQKFIKHKTIGTDAQQIILLPKIETDPDIDDQINMTNNTSPLRSPHVQQQQQQQLELTTLPTLTGPHLQQTTPNQNLDTTNNHQLTTLEHQDNNNTTENICVTANYDEMDIDNFINGDGGAHEPNNDDDDDMEGCDDGDGDGDDDDDDEEHQQIDLKPKLGQYSDYNVNSSSADEDREYISLKMVTVSGQNTMTTSNINQTLHMTNNQHHSITLEDTNTMQQQQEQNDEFQRPQTPSLSTSLSVQTTPISNNNIRIATQTNVQQQHQQQQQQHHHHHENTISPQQQQRPTKSEDDEIGAFFKAIAMKIRTANLPPVAFTELQIDILRVINESLRHH